MELTERLRIHVCFALRGNENGSSQAQSCCPSRVILRMIDLRDRTHPVRGKG
jgi:hypothetical protein